MRITLFRITMQMQFSLTTLSLRENMYKSMEICIWLILKINFNRSISEYTLSGACSANNVTENFRENLKLTVSDLHVRSSKDVSLGKSVFGANETEILQSVWVGHKHSLSRTVLGCCLFADVTWSGLTIQRHILKFQAGGTGMSFAGMFGQGL